MRLVHMLRERFVPERFRGIVTEVAKFGAVGLVNTVLDYAVLNLLLSAGPLKAKVVSTIVATTASYLMNRHWTFNTRDRAGLRREYTLFFALNLVGLVIQLTVLGTAKYGLGFTEHGGGDDRLVLNLFNALGIGVAMMFRFWAYRTFVFTHAPERAPGTDEIEAELTAIELTAIELTAIELTANKPTADKLTADQPTADKLTADQPTADQPTGDEPAASELAASRA